MMSDLEKMKAIFSELGVGYKVITAKEDRGKDIHTIKYGEGVTWDTMIHLEDEDGEDVGYPGFYCDFYFLNGEYQKYGIWE